MFFIEQVSFLSHGGARRQMRWIQTSNSIKLCPVKGLGDWAHDLPQLLKHTGFHAVLPQPTGAN